MRFSILCSHHTYLFSTDYLPQSSRLTFSPDYLYGGKLTKMTEVAKYNLRFGILCRLHINLFSTDYQRTRLTFPADYPSGGKRTKPREGAKYFNPVISRERLPRENGSFLNKLIRVTASVCRALGRNVAGALASPVICGLMGCRGFLCSSALLDRIFGEIRAICVNPYNGSCDNMEDLSIHRYKVVVV